MGRDEIRAPLKTPAWEASEGHTIVFYCRPTLARHITLQILDKQFLQIKCLKINGGDLLNQKEPFLYEKK